MTLHQWGSGAAKVRNIGAAGGWALARVLPPCEVCPDPGRRPQPLAWERVSTSAGSRSHVIRQRNSAQRDVIDLDTALRE